MQFLETLLPMADTINTEKNIKTLSGTVVSVKMQDTLVVAVDRYVKHPIYGKYRRTTKRYKVHSPGDDSFSVGEKVLIASCRPISKEKHFRFLQKVTL